MISPKKAANAIGGKTARACESCLRKRARWYCAADDAFLCQACDSSVHSANQLASRHERVRLETASYKPTAPAWHHGFTRKARTPRHHKPTPPHAQPPKDDQKGSSCPLPLVPEIGSEEASVDENEEQLLYRVPIFDPFAAELCNLENEAENEMRSTERNGLFTDNEACNLDNLPGFLTSDMELAEFAANVESLLGREHEEECGGVEALGLLECRQEDVCMDMWVDERRVKVEDEELEAVVASQLDPALDMTREMSGWNLGYESPVIGGDGEEEKKVMGGEEQTEVKRNIFLRLNYEAVMAAWAGQGSPWTTGIQPDFNPDDVWLGFMELYSGGGGGGGGGVGIERYGGVGGRFIGGDEGREARVSRYREKRRSRLFSKKIRYQVRKLNAEKRPRMKGRFVKRASFVGPAFPYLVNK